MGQAHRGKEKGKEKGKEVRKETTNKKGSLKTDHGDPDSPILLNVEGQKEGATARSHRFTVGDALLAYLASMKRHELPLRAHVEVLISLYGQTPLSLLTLEMLKIWVATLFVIPRCHEDPRLLMPRSVSKVLGDRHDLARRVINVNRLIRIMRASLGRARVNGWLDLNQTWPWLRPFKTNLLTWELVPTDRRRLEELLMKYYGPFTPILRLRVQENPGGSRTHGLQSRPTSSTLSEALDLWRSKP